MPARPSPPRAAHFAAGVRRRVGHARPGRGASAVSHVDQVLRLATRLWTARRSGVPIGRGGSTVHLGLRWDVAAPVHRVEIRRELRTVTVLGSLIREPAAVGHVMPTVLRHSDGVASVAKDPVAPARGPDVVRIVERSTGHAGSRADASLPHGPSRVPEVHRHAVVPGRQPVEAEARGELTGPAQPPLPVRWSGELSGGSRSAALTAADVPGVVDHVVRELDRRVTAARERKGWTG